MPYNTVNAKKKTFHDRTKKVCRTSSDIICVGGETEYTEKAQYTKIQMPILFIFDPVEQIEQGFKLFTSNVGIFPPKWRAAL